jgi:hypothetical protein
MHNLPLALDGVRPTEFALSIRAPGAVGSYSVFRILTHPTLFNASAQAFADSSGGGGTTCPFNHRLLNPWGLNQHDKGGGD